MLPSPTIFMVCDDIGAPCFCSISSSALAASGSALSAFVSAACSACMFSGSFGAASASFVASSPASLDSFPLIQAQTDLPDSPAALLAASLPRLKRSGATNETAAAAGVAGSMSRSLALESGVGMGTLRRRLQILEYLGDRREQHGGGFDAEPLARLQICSRHGGHPLRVSRGPAQEVWCKCRHDFSPGCERLFE